MILAFPRDCLNVKVAVENHDPVFPTLGELQLLTQGIQISIGQGVGSTIIDMPCMTQGMPSGPTSGITVGLS